MSKKTSQSRSSETALSSSEPPANADISTYGGADGPVLSVIIVTYNESNRIKCCIESILDVCDDIPSSEILLVDSNSTDETVEIACEYPITVYQLPSDDVRTPGAGRYVGTNLASGEYLLFVDGDLKLEDGWFSDALQLVENRDDIAGVDGYLNESKASSIVQTDALNGVALYDRDAIDDVGSFDPHLHSLEDIELGYRLVTTDYQLLRLPDVVAMHPKASGISEYRRRWQNKYFHGFGQAIRKSLLSPDVLAKLVWRHNLETLFVCWLCFGALALAIGGKVTVGWVVISLGIFTADSYYKGIRNAADRYLRYTLMWAGFFIGFVAGPLDSARLSLGNPHLVSIPEKSEPLLSEQDSLSSGSERSHLKRET